MKIEEEYRDILTIFSEFAAEILVRRGGWSTLLFFLLFWKDFEQALKSGSELGLGFTHEEQITRLMKPFIQSHKDLPVFAYQIQTKFRNELRAKSGIMRGREFFMKDLYSFAKDTEDHEAFYEKAKEAYIKVFDRLGLGEQTVVTFASGGVFSEFSHEFQTFSDAGEDTIFVSKEKGIAINKEVYSDGVLESLALISWM